MNSDISVLIMEEEKRINQLHADIHTHLKHRYESPQATERWHRACEAFRAYRSPLLSYYTSVYQESVYSNKELIGFVIRFLEIDPHFFRSGYIKEHMLCKLKRALLNESQKSRLRSLLLDAVLHRGTREYRHYCRLAAVLLDPHFVKQLLSLAADGNPKVKSRANMMLRFIGR